MTYRILATIFLVVLVINNSKGQEVFNSEAYKNYRNSTVNFTSSQLKSEFPLPNEAYFKGFENVPSLDQIAYLDSIIQKLQLTNDELSLLEKNRFFVSERMSHRSFGDAFHTIYNHDLPVFITTDAILHALHASYDKILKTLERQVMKNNLEQYLESLYNSIPDLHAKYQGSTILETGLEDAALYITIAYSLIKDELQPSNYTNNERLNTIWDAIGNEQMVNLPLFTFNERLRKLDFSQFTVRGHYVYTEEDKIWGFPSLEPYFRTMMWLGRIDFLVTPPPKNPFETDWEFEEIQRMNIAAFMCNELVQSSDKKSLFEQNEEIINYLVGESDNATPDEYQSAITAAGISTASQLTDSITLSNFLSSLQQIPELSQKILSNFYLMDPLSDEPGVLPISYKLSGQRFIIDSYILGNVVYDKIVFNGEKKLRMMPDPFDALFALGNNDVLPFLQEELDRYYYSGQLANLRYLVDHKSSEFWDESLYNVWLNSLRKLNPDENKDELPLFMQSAAWHQQKMNTQLASWAQLRHDNLLYAKQSYTGGTGCSYPYSYVEPYPEFYRTVKQFAENAGNFFQQISLTNTSINQIKNYFPKLAEATEKLSILAQKELDGKVFSDDENEWLQSMLFALGGSGMPPYTGWYSELFFDEWDAASGDYTIVDVHTQPTDKSGNVVGKVLHVGVGEINLGVFIADCPGTENEQMAFVGPTMSYYQTITDNFKRMTDEEWSDMVNNSTIPERPDWTNIYLAGENGEAKEAGRELPSMLYLDAGLITLNESGISNLKSFPNPFTDNLTLTFSLKSNANIAYKIINILGETVYEKPNQFLSPGMYSENINLTGINNGLYFCHIQVDGLNSETIKIMKH